MYVAAPALLAANLIPLAGVLYFDWSLFTVMLLFWADNVVIGVFAAARVGLARHHRRPQAAGAPLPSEEATLAKFIFGYFAGTLAHGVLVVVVFGPIELHLPELAAGALALAASRGYDFHAGYLRPKAYERAYAIEEIGLAFTRVMLLHVALIGGVFLIIMEETRVAALALLVALKAAGDLYASWHSLRAGRRGLRG